MIAVSAPKFQLGRVVATPGAISVLEDAGQSPWSLVARHAACDWGDLPEDDRQLNEDALQDGSRLMSSYTLNDGKTTLWVVTEAADDTNERSVTTILAPDEY